MINLTTDVLELRGIKNAMSKKGNVYYVLNCEDDGGEACKFVCKNFDSIPSGLKKGDKVQLKVAYNNFKDLDVLGVEKVS